VTFSRIFPAPYRPAPPSKNPDFPRFRKSDFRGSMLCKGNPRPPDPRHHIIGVQEYKLIRARAGAEERQTDPQCPTSRHARKHRAASSIVGLFSQKSSVWRSPASASAPSLRKRSNRSDCYRSTPRIDLFNLRIFRALAPQSKSTLGITASLLICIEDLSSFR